MDRSAEGFEGYLERAESKKVVVGHIEARVQELQLLVGEQVKWEGLVALFAALFAR